ncbi:hypothetical protein [Sphingomonas sp. SORGH_AS_0879]|uniref:hypothetical protein n=1 Tax=Sphingomonas sp. SORGH_AS_0879 TaxID=3041790 RepID=UPI0027D7F3AB|nr:hypothetical protein [Sphingomonas sp. SORGH_AS_0879]
MKQNFGLWLVAQHQREDWVGLFAFQARRDRAFPLEADPAGVRAYLKTKGADADAIDMLETAALEWGRA